MDVPTDSATDVPTDSWLYNHESFRSPLVFGGGVRLLETERENKHKNENIYFYGVGCIGVTPS